MKTQPRTLGRRAEAIALACLLACLGALGLRAATQTTTFDPAAATVGNARLLELAITQYVQDSDEVLPPMHTVAEFKTALRPFVPDPTVFVSRVTGKPFMPNPAISGKSLAAFSQPGTTVVFRDGAAQSTVAFLDSHIERGGVVQGDPKAISVANARTLALGVAQYEQDNDEFLPPTKTLAGFKAAISPFVRDPRFFVDPLNGKPFVLNPALSGVSISSVSNPHNTVLLQSATPYPNGVPTIAYVDGHVIPILERSASDQDQFNLNSIGLATQEYSQDYNETLPPTNDYAAFVNALNPYLQDTSFFVSPGTELPYILNPAISGAYLTSIDNLDGTEIARDAQIYPDGVLNHLEVDGSIHQDRYFVPKLLAIDSKGQTQLFWPKLYQQAAIWTFSSNGITKNTYLLAGSGNAAAFSIGSDSQTRILSRRGYPIDYFGVPVTGAITLDTIGPDNTQESSTQFGPYDGWTAFFLTTGADNSSRLLWQRYDGALALWTLSPEGDYLGSAALPRLGGGTPVGLALGADGLTRLLWQTTRGGGKLWIIAPSGQVAHSFDVPAPSGYQLTGLGLGADGASRILWSDGQNHAVVRTLRANGSVAGSVTFTLAGGGTASQIAVGKAGDLRVLWTASNGSGQLQTLTAAGTQTGVQSLTPYQ